MDPDFWHRRWRNNQIGFHEGAPNTLLTAHFAELGVPAGARLFVPLCGKSHDLLWLRAQGYRVVGAELSRLAVEQFFAEQDLTPSVTSAGPFERFDAEGVTIFLGDIFDLTPERLGAVDAVHDRAALIALPPPVRERYTGHLIALTGGAPQFLVTFDYDQAQASGPPFSVEEAEVRRHYESSYRLELAERREAAGGMKGICPARESAWLMKRR